MQTQIHTERILQQMKCEVIFSCGHKIEYTLNSDIKSIQRILTYCRNYMQCFDCSIENYSDKPKDNRITLICSVLPHINNDTGDIQLMFEIRDNIENKEDIIKELGFTFGKFSAGSFYEHLNGWHCIVNECDLEKKISTIIQIFPDINLISRVAYANLLNGTKARTEHERWKQRQESSANPNTAAPPEILGNMHWNNKIYSSNNKKYIYLDGKKTFISNEDAECLDNYLSKLDDIKESDSKHILT